MGGFGFFWEPVLLALLASRAGNFTFREMVSFCVRTQLVSNAQSLAFAASLFENTMLQLSSGHIFLLEQGRSRTGMLREPETTSCIAGRPVHQSLESMPHRGKESPLNPPDQWRRSKRLHPLWSFSASAPFPKRICDKRVVIEIRTLS